VPQQERVLVPEVVKFSAIKVELRLHVNPEIGVTVNDRATGPAKPFNDMTVMVEVIL
jgi:hypothetical protein